MIGGTLSVFKSICRQNSEIEIIEGFLDTIDAHSEYKIINQTIYIPLVVNITMLY